MFELSIVTPNKKLVSGAEMDEVFVPAFKGELNILPGHAPLVSTLSEGVLRYRLKEDQQEHAVAISWGYVEVTPAGVSILAETAESKEEIDLSRAEETLKNAEKYLSGDSVKPEDIEKYFHKIKRAEARISVVKDH